MKRKRSPIVLKSLDHEANQQLREMIEELGADGGQKASRSAKSSTWRRRFAPSGKAIAPKLRRG